MGEENNIELPTIDLTTLVTMAIGGLVRHVLTYTSGVIGGLLVSHSILTEEEFTTWWGLTIKIIAGLSPFALALVLSWRQKKRMLNKLAIAETETAIAKAQTAGALQ